MKQDPRLAPLLPIKILFQIIMFGGMSKMFFAINKDTKEKINSLTIENNPSYQFIEEDIWYADADEIESCPNEIDINNIKVRFRVGSSAISIKGNKYDISPHFFIPNKEKLGINTIPESKEHKLAKNWIYTKIKAKKLIINYSSISKPYKYKNSLNLFELPIDYPMVGIETSSSTFGYKKIRRADIICPFITKHPILGNGIVFEIQFTNQKNKTKIDRELDWAIRGYSISWLFKEDFEEIGDDFIELKRKDIDVNSFSSLIKKANKLFIKNLKYCVQEQCRQLDEKKYEIISEIRNKKLEQFEINKIDIRGIVEGMFDELKNNFQPKCPKCGSLMLLKGRYGNNFWGCGNYPHCKSTMSYID